MLYSCSVLHSIQLSLSLSQLVTESKEHPVSFPHAWYRVKLCDGLHQTTVVEGIMKRDAKLAIGKTASCRSSVTSFHKSLAVSALFRFGQHTIPPPLSPCPPIQVPRYPGTSYSVLRTPAKSATAHVVILLVRHVGHVGLAVAMVTPSLPCALSVWPCFRPLIGLSLSLEHDTRETGGKLLASLSLSPVSVFPYLLTRQHCHQPAS